MLDIGTAGTVNKGDMFFQWLGLYDGDYTTYIGSLYSGVLKDLDSGETKDWREESIRILEGGKEAFNERGDIYAQ